MWILGIWAPYNILASHQQNLGLICEVNLLCIVGCLHVNAPHAHVITSVSLFITSMSLVTTSMSLVRSSACCLYLQDYSTIHVSMLPGLDTLDWCNELSCADRYVL